MAQRKNLLDSIEQDGLTRHPKDNECRLIQVLGSEGTLRYNLLNQIKIESTREKIPPKVPPPERC
jgi:hypothetical protein